MEWDKLVNVVTKVKKAVNLFQRNNEKVQEICKKYFEQLDVELATPGECKAVERIDEQLEEIEKDLERVLRKASDKVFINFVGATSSGKSTLINALLKEERLPAGFAETTMCLIEICTTDEEQWSVKVNETILSNIKEVDDIKKLLDAMSNDDLKEEREKLKINESSVVRVDWPKTSSKVLPENVVLVDTPGFGEDIKCDQALRKSCETADIIVAVMDSKSPSKAHVTKLVKEVNCQYAFGVFTKWDEIEENQKKENSAISLDNLRKTNTEKYLKSVNSDRSTCTADDIFFVDSLHVLRNSEELTWTDDDVLSYGVSYYGQIVFGNPEKEDSSRGVLEFQRFEKRLAEIAKKKKGELLESEVKAVAEKAKGVYDRFKTTVEERKKKKLDRLNKTLDSLKAGGESFKKICQSLKRSIDRDIGDISMNDIIKQFEEEINTGNLSEEDAFKKFRDAVNEKINETIPSKTTSINKELKNWEDGMARVLPLSQSEVSITESEIPQLNSGELPNDRYNYWLDFHSYYTNNYFMGAVVTGALGVTCGVGLGAMIGAEMVVTGLAGGATAGGVFGMPVSWVAKRGFSFGIGDMIKKYVPFSEKKMGCWKAYLVEISSKACKDNQKLMNDKIDTIKEETSCEVDRVKSETEKEKNKLESTSHHLNEWPIELDSRRKEVQDIIHQKINPLF